MAIEGMPDRKLTRVNGAPASGRRSRSRTRWAACRRCRPRPAAADMALDGVIAEVIYPTFGLFIDMIPAPISRWRARRSTTTGGGDVPAPTRRLHPVRDRAGTRRRRRPRPSSNASSVLGFKAATIPTTPPEGVPYNRPTTTRCGRSRADAAIPLSLHTGTGALPQHERGPGGAIINYAKVGLLSAETLCYFAASGVLERFPGLHLVFVETGAGWLAYCCERMDEAFEEHERLGEARSSGAAGRYVKTQCHVTLGADRAAVARPRDHRHRTAAVGERLPAPRRHVPRVASGRRTHLRRRARSGRWRDRQRQRRPPLPARDRREHVVARREHAEGQDRGRRRRGDAVLQARRSRCRRRRWSWRARRCSPRSTTPGLTVDDLDGFALYSMGFDTSLFAQWLGVPEVRFTAHAHRRRRRRGGLGRARGGGDRERHGRVRRVGDDAATGGEPLRRVVRAARRARAARPYTRAAVARGQLHPAVGADGPGPDVRGARAAAHAPLRHDARALRRGRDLHPRATRSGAPTSLMQEPLTLDEYFARADDLRPAVPLRLLPRVRRRGRGGHDVGRAGARPAAPARVRAARRRTAGTAGGVRRSRGWACPTSTSRRRVTARSRERLYEMAGDRPRRRRRRAALRPLLARW